MKNIFSKLFAWLFGNKEKPSPVQSQPPVQAPAPDPVIIPTEPPIVVPPVVVPDPPKVEPIPEPVKQPVIVPVEPEQTIIGTGSGNLKLSNVSGKNIKIKPGTYSGIEVGECSNAKIDATGVSMTKDGSVYFTRPAENVELYGLRWDAHNYRPINIQAFIKGLYLHDMSFRNVSNYVISDEWGGEWDGTDATAKTNWKLENLSFEKCGPGFNGKSNIDVAGNKIFGLYKNLKMTGITVKNCHNMGAFMWLGACDGYDISNVNIDGVNLSFPDKNLPNGPHNGIFAITGNGKLHGVTCQNHQGNLIRAWAMSFSKSPALIELYNNKVFKSHKYGAFEIQTPPHLQEFLDKNKGKFTFSDAKVYGNVAGKLNKSKDWEGQMLDLYNFGGGSLAYYDNTGFEMVASNPQYHPVTNMINNMSNAKVAEYNNKYYATQAEAGINIDDDPDPDPPGLPKPEPIAEAKPEPVIIQLPKPDTLPPAATLRDSVVKWGIAFKESHLDKKTLVAFAAKHFSLIEPENGFKVGHIQKKQGVFDFSHAKEAVKIAKANKMDMYAHTCFCWPSQEKKLSAFWHEAAKDKDKYIALIKNTIQTTVRTFKDDVFKWEISNEAFENNGKLRPCYALTHLGPDYMEQYAKWILEIQPKAQLFINDFGLETDASKVNVIIDYAINLKKKGLLHGISSQMHTIPRMDVNNYRKNLKRMAAGGLLVHISELDIRYKIPAGATDLTDVQKKDKAKKYQDIVQGFVDEVPVKQRVAISVWSLRDHDNVLNIYDETIPYRPAIFNRDMDGGLTLEAILSVK